MTLIVIQDRILNFESWNPSKSSHELCVSNFQRVISQSMPSGNSFSIPWHPQLIFMLATRFHNEHKQFVYTVHTPNSAMTLFIGPQALGA